MSFLIVLAIVVTVLFFVAFLTKRRFGVLGLALAAGAFMSTLWVGDVTPLIAEAGIVTVQPPLESIVGAGLILLPAAVLLISGPVYRNKSQRGMGAFLFALLAVTLLLDSLGAALVIDGPGQVVYSFLDEYRIFVVTACLIVALLDIIAIKTPKMSAKH